MLDFLNQFKKKPNGMSRDKIAELLKISPEAFAAFEKEYSVTVLNQVSDDFFHINAKQAASEKEGILCDEQYKIGDIKQRIADELLSEAEVSSYGNDGTCIRSRSVSGNPTNTVTPEEILSLPEDLRPQFTGSMMLTSGMNFSSGETATFVYSKYLQEKNQQKKQFLYHLFRQGLDILDYDWLLYQMIGTNPNSIGYWFPALAKAVKLQDFFKIPATTIMKVPMPVLQMTRIGYDALTRTTLDIVDDFCFRAFNLSEDRDYFIKTGTYSSKFDFRNAHVHGENEVRQLGEYLLFIHYQANMMADPLSNPCMYGVSTTNEWAVREFIPDHENNPCIYKGLPLHTEYRVFVDFNTKEILGMASYWDPDVMKKHFGRNNDPDNIHDYVVYKSHEDILMKRYHENKDIVALHVQQLVQDMNFHGQWSVDIMQNENDFWIIDMALAKNSALSNCVPDGKLKSAPENWIPELSEDVLS